MAVTGNVNVSTITRLEWFEEWFKLNKDFKFIREHRSRKDSAEHTNIDLYNYFLLSPDPIICELDLQAKCSKKLRLDPEALQMLKAPKIRSNTNSDSE